MYQAIPHVTITPYSAKTPADVASAVTATVVLTDQGLPPAAASRASSQRRYSLAAGLIITLSALRAIMLRLRMTNHILPVYSRIPSPTLSSTLPTLCVGVRILS